MLTGHTHQWVALTIKALTVHRLGGCTDGQPHTTLCTTAGTMTRSFSALPGSQDSQYSPSHSQPPPAGSARVAQRCSQAIGRQRGGTGVSKKVSKKWTEEEQHVLLEAVNQHGSEIINWADVARSVPGRTGKQCREKWKNDLRPDISKEPWTSREEYILSRAHSEVGNQWSEIAKYLPQRSENSIKNHWNATLRSKAETKTRTFLWVYGKVVLDQKGTTSADTFEKARRQYIKMAGVEALEHMQLPEDYFQRLATAPKSPIKVSLGRKQPVRPARKRNWTSSESDSFSEDSEGMPESDSEDQGVRHGSRQAIARATSLPCQDHLHGPAGREPAVQQAATPQRLLPCPVFVPAAHHAAAHRVLLHTARLILPPPRHPGHVINAAAPAAPAH